MLSQTSRPFLDRHGMLLTRADAVYGSHETRPENV